MMRRSGISALILFLATAPSAQAHTGHMDLVLRQDFIAGLLHPLAGLDHLLAIMAMGLIAAQRYRGIAYGALSTTRRGYGGAGIVATFLTAMLVGFVFPASPGVLGGDMLTILSVAVFGGLIAFADRAPKVLRICVVTGFAYLHGQAHAVESSHVQPVFFAMGMLWTTLCLAGVMTLLGVWGGDALSLRRGRAARAGVAERTVGGGFMLSAAFLAAAG